MGTNFEVRINGEFLVISAVLVYIVKKYLHQLS